MVFVVLLYPFLSLATTNLRLHFVNRRLLFYLSRTAITSIALQNAVFYQHVTKYA